MHHINPYLYVSLLPLALLMEYFCCYAVLRLRGRLCVGHDGWHAEGLGIWGMPMVPALLLFRFFHIPMRFESLARRVLARLGKKNAPETVSDVAVEFVPFA